MSSDKYRGDVPASTGCICAAFSDETRDRNRLVFLPAISSLGLPGGRIALTGRNRCVDLDGLAAWVICAQP